MWVFIHIYIVQRSCYYTIWDNLIAPLEMWTGNGRVEIVQFQHLGNTTGK